MNGPDHVPAGWYVDQDMVDTQRYWDGSTWTGDVRPMVDTAQTPLQPAPGPVLIRKQTKKGNWGAAILLSTLGLLGLMVIGAPVLFLFFLVGSLSDNSTGDLSDYPDDVAEATVAAGTAGESGSIRVGAEFPFGQQVEVRPINPVTASEERWLMTVDQPFDISDSLQDDSPAVAVLEGRRYLAFDVQMELIDAVSSDATSAAIFDVMVRGGATGEEHPWFYNDVCANANLLDRDTFAVSDVVDGRICMLVWDEDVDHPDTQVILRTSSQDLVFGN